MNDNNITIQDFIDGPVMLDVIQGIKVEVFRMQGKYLVILHDRRDSKNYLYVSWLDDEHRSIDKICEIQKRYRRET